jgi:ferrochelatase
MDQRGESCVKSAVLLLAYGGPQCLADVPAYLSGVRGGREPSPGLVEEFTDRYRQIGGRSPLIEITHSTAVRLREVLGMPVYVGMRYWQPSVEEAVARMAADDIRCCIAVCMAPHAGRLTSGAYRARLNEAVRERFSPRGELAITFVDHWHTQPDYLGGIAANIRATLLRFPPERRVEVLVIFTAHSLPASILEWDDPYPSQVWETAAMVAERLELAQDRWTFCYQSARRDGATWLGPQVESLVQELAEAGERDLLLAPVGFVADNLEVLYDLDIGVRRIAAGAGVRLERMPMLNDSPGLVDALADVVRSRLGS